MIKKMIAASIAAVMAVSMFSTGVMAEPSGEKVSAGEIQFEIPAKYQDMLTVKTEGLEPNTIVEVSETKSIEAAQKKEQNTDGAGMLFSISRISENELRKLRCDNMDGMEVFAEDDDMYYLFNHPTDVRIYREDNISDADMELWGDLNEWANTAVRGEILQNNRELDEKHYTNTSLDMFLAKAAFDPNTKFEIRSLSSGTLDPRAGGEDDFIEDLTEEFTYEAAPEIESPDGEYLVLFFPEENVRFDFFEDPEHANVIREVATVDGEEIVTMFKAEFDRFDDDQKTAGGVMQRWIQSLTQGGVEYDD